MNNENLSIENRENQLERGFSLLLLKPLAMQSPLVVGEIRSLVEERCEITFEIYIPAASRDSIKRHYESVMFDSAGKITRHYPALVEYMAGKSLEVWIVEPRNFECNPNYFPKFLKDEVIGHFIPVFAEQGTVRSLAIKYAMPYLQILSYENQGNVGQNFIYDNLIHSSGTLEESLSEIETWFPNSAIFEHYSRRYLQLKK